ncbi:thrombomodulin [Pimephales promelas]|uniref:thrombomodulin n=1 Tax=Pimephales promelas TaxID=90988 RepID=UPI001955BAD8|nr:thrombomodulin [Pimephales promelas]
MRGIIGMALALVVLKVHAGKISDGHCEEGKCFAIQTTSLSFDSAQRVCQERGGHLMTVRYRKSANILAKLLNGTSGNFWLGLKYQCAHANDGLKGYKWVTGDNASHYINWESDRPVCSPRCASVSQKVPKWAERPCDDIIDGYLCEYEILEYCQALSNGSEVVYEIPFGFNANKLLQEIPQGTIATLQPLRTKHVCFEGDWLQAPWSCEFFNGGCEYACEGSIPNITCICPQGYKLDSNRVTCSTQDACAHGECEPAIQVAYAMSPEDCKPGFHKESGISADEDECVSGPCEHICINTIGSYQCECYEGFIQSKDDMHTCVMHCTEEQCPAECDPNNNEQCNCPDGFLLEDTMCLDIDECTSNYCDHKCDNTPGGYVCSCREGYLLLKDGTCEEKDFDGSGSSTPFDVAISTSKPPTKPMSISSGSLLAIMVCIVACILLLVGLAHCTLRRFCQLHNYDVHKGQDEVYDFQQVIIDKNSTELSFPNRYLKRDV